MDVGKDLIMHININININIDFFALLAPLAPVNHEPDELHQCHHRHRAPEPSLETPSLDPRPQESPPARHHGSCLQPQLQISGASRQGEKVSVYTTTGGAKTKEGDTYEGLSGEGLVVDGTSSAGVVGVGVVGRTILKGMSPREVRTPLDWLDDGWQWWIWFGD